MQPVHLISPTLNLPDTLIKHFSHSPSGKTPLLPVTYVWHQPPGNSGPTHTYPSILKLSSITLSSARYTLVFDHRLTIIFGCAFGYSLLLFAMDKDTDNAKDVPATATSVPSSPSTLTTAVATDVFARRSCPRWARRMNSLQFDKHTLCVVCRDVKCSLDTRCKECKAWSKEFMLGCVKHQRSLVSKGKKLATTSPSPPVTAVTTAPIVSLPSLPVSEECFRQLMRSMLQDMLQSGSLGINQSSTAPPAVPDSASKITKATGGLRSVMPVEALSTESPGVVLPTFQEDHPPPPYTVSVCVCVICSKVWGF